MYLGNDQYPDLLQLFVNSSQKTSDGGAGNTTMRTTSGKLHLGAGGGRMMTLDNTTQRVGIGTETPSYKLHVAGDILAANGWLRSSGDTGWYSETYGGGWYMKDSVWIRNYNNKRVAINTSLNVGANVIGDLSSGIALGDTTVDFTPTTANWTTTGTTLLLNALNYSTIGFHDSGNRVDFIRVGNKTITLGYDGGWGAATVKIPGRLVIPVGYDLFATE
ncbi:hypothetical protein D3C72_1624440 [compost metagenome]